ncbi:hypothetical protein GCM10008018_46400 [Paenibacillus marchantiophytorum]|uniref:Uncharacterized protein n=1 Tax=Paenibacillus marchantiophytorum TaxID=1619310 RepID=A0ABQ1EZQ3_9BACL|nr:hypothetical protein GCM10008018_46400 [Paenibacillus marchantiophytorum]
MPNSLKAPRFILRSLADFAIGHQEKSSIFTTATDLIDGAINRLGDQSAFMKRLQIFIGVRNDREHFQATNHGRKAVMASWDVLKRKIVPNPPLTIFFIACPYFGVFLNEIL